MATESEIEKTVLPPPLFNYDAYDLLGEWNQWFQKLKDYLVANDRADSPDEEKIRVMLSHLGNKGKEIYESLEAKDNPGERITSFEELSEALALYFGSIRNVLFERFKFFKMKRRSGLSVVGFAQDLTVAASFCAFTEEDNIIRDKLLEQLKDTGLIERLLVEGGSLTLERAIEICQKWEVRESKANECKPHNSEDDPEPPNSSATNDSRRKLDSMSRTDPEVTIKEELDASDSSPVATPAQPHLWLPAEDEPTGSTSDHHLDWEIKTEQVDEDEEMTFHSPLVISTAVSDIQNDPLSVVEQSKDHHPDWEIKTEQVDEDEEMTFHSPLAISTAVSDVQNDPLSVVEQSKDGEIKMELVDRGEDFKFLSPIIILPAGLEVPTDPHSADMKDILENVSPEDYQLQDVGRYQILHEAQPLASPGGTDSSEENDFGRKVRRSSRIFEEEGSSVSTPKFIEGSSTSHHESPQFPARKQDGHQIRRSHSCFFCGQMQMNIGRHIIKNHREEEEVRLIINLPAKDSKRKEVLSELRKKGDYRHSLSNPLLPIPVRRGLHLKSTDKLVACSHCRGMFVKSNLYRHTKKCGMRRHGMLKESRAMSLFDNYAVINEKFVKKIVSPMRNVTYKHMILKDPLLTQYGMDQMERYFNSCSSHLANRIRSRLNAACSVFAAFKNLVPDTVDFSGIFLPSHYPAFVVAVKEVAGWTPDGKIRAPTTVTAAAAVVTAIAKIHANQKINQGKSTADVDAWLRVFTTSFDIQIGDISHKVRTNKSWEKPKWFPLTDDLNKFIQYTKAQRDDAMSRLSKQFDNGTYVLLCKATIVKVLSFNRKRVGDIDKMLLSDFERRAKVNTSSGICNMLDESEKILAERYYYITIRGKLNRPVPVLLDDTDVEAINLIVAQRREAQVAEDNMYLFAKGENSFQQGSAAIHEFAEKCGASNPRHITGTSLRKYLASTSQALAMNDNELSVLSDFLGHTEETHHRFYRLSDQVLHTAEISRLLIHLNEGTVNQLKVVNLFDAPVDGVADGMPTGGGEGTSATPILTTPLPPPPSEDTITESASPVNTPLPDE